MRTVIATFLVPIVVVGGVLLPSLLGSRRAFDGPDAVVFTVVSQYLFALAFTVVVVLVLRYFWKRWDFMRGWVATAIGLGIGWAVATAFILTYPNIPMFASGYFPLAAYARVFLILGITGALAGVLFWLIAKAEMRPNTSFERTREG
jgi:hypothetical protein